MTCGYSFDDDEEIRLGAVNLHLVIEVEWAPSGNPMVSFEGARQELFQVLNVLGEPGLHRLGANVDGMEVTCGVSISDAYHWVDDVGDALPHIAVSEDGLRWVVKGSASAMRSFSGHLEPWMESEFGQVGYASHEFIFSEGNPDARLSDAVVAFAFYIASGASRI